MKKPQENMQEWITILDLREQRLNHQEGTASRQQNPSGMNKNVWQKFYKKSASIEQMPLKGQ
jgi:hypothetical protein